MNWGVGGWDTNIQSVATGVYLYCIPLGDSCRALKFDPLVYLMLM